MLQDFATIGLLVVLEGVLSLDNALVLALLVKHLPRAEQKKALSYGLIGAFVFRTIALFLAAYLMHWLWVKIIGGAYLIFIVLQHWWSGKKHETKGQKVRSFWMTVVAVELADIAFAIDSILTAVAVSPKLWVIISGGVIGIVVMRYGSFLFVRLLEKFPRLEVSAYLLVFIVGIKLLGEGLQWKSLDQFADIGELSYWISLGLALAIGFLPQRKRQ